MNDFALYLEVDHILFAVLCGLREEWFLWHLERWYILIFVIIDNYITNISEEYIYFLSMKVVAIYSSEIL